jgi:cell fate (sporulation/competence/biofilm development) regulator YlbF (YheA/YmcA/DUF963 family)
MDIVAVLTKVVQEQKQTLDEKVKLIMRQQQTLESVLSELVKLRADVARIKNRTD